MTTKSGKANLKKKFTAQEMVSFAHWYHENCKPFECNLPWHLERWLSLPVVPGDMPVRQVGEKKICLSDEDTKTIYKKGKAISKRRLNGIKNES